MTNPSVGSHQLQVACVRAILGNTSEKSLIDLCAGNVEALREFKFREQIHVDVMQPPTIPPHLPFLQIDVLAEHDVFAKKYDIVTCMDGIEHLKPEDGIRLLERMEKLAPQRVLFTPLGNMWVGHVDDPNPLVHKSEWHPIDFERRGWSTLVFPQWHKAWNFGAIFAWSGDDGKAEERLQRILP